LLIRPPEFASVLNPPSGWKTPGAGLCFVCRMAESIDPSVLDLLIFPPVVVSVLNPCFG
jgi:hypothetical protein